MKALLVISVLSFISSFLVLGAFAQAQCGNQAGDAVCPGGFCCSKWGYCGNTPDYCGDGCQSQCTPGGGGGGGTPTPNPPNPTPTPSGGGDLSSIIPESLFNEMLKHRGDSPCHGAFYTYSSFINAASSFSGFGTTGDGDTRKKEIAAFFGQTSHETTGGWASAPDGPFAWGYCFIREGNNPAGDQSYSGRGPIQLTGDYNYRQAGEALGLDLLNNPDLVATDPVISFKTALWFWMTPQSPKPSCHDVITGTWRPSDADTSAGRVPGYGMLTNIINGGVECANRANDKVQDRIGFYTRYCGLFGVITGDNLDCANQAPYGS